MNDRQKKQYAKALKRAEEMDGYCLSEDYNNSNDRMLWKCSNTDHPAWEATYSNIVYGKKWCPICAHGWPASKTRADNAALKHDGYCLSEKNDIIDYSSMLVWKCNNSDHPAWVASYGQVVSRKTWCPICNRGYPVVIGRAHEAAENNDGCCLSDENDLDNAYSMLRWRCSKGHEWKATYNNVVNNKTWCYICMKGERANIQTAIDAAAALDGYCLSDEKELKNTKSVLGWMCSKGHEWAASYSNVTRGSWCSICNRGEYATIECAQEKAKEKGGECLSTHCGSVNDVLRWRCVNGHEWEAYYSSVVGGDHWCATCSAFKTQKRLAEILEDLLSAKSQTIRPDWLKNPETNRNLEIDIYFPKLKIAVEYNGKLHYMPVDYFGGEKSFNRRKHRDRLKKQLISQNPRHVKHFVIFTYEDEITEQAVRQKLIKEGVLKCDST